MKCSCLVHSVEWYEERLIDFLRSIFDPSIDDARRLISYGMQNVYRFMELTTAPITVGAKAWIVPRGRWPSREAGANPIYLGYCHQNVLEGRVK